MSALNLSRFATTLTSTCKRCRPQLLPALVPIRALSTNSNHSADIDQLLRAEGDKAKKGEEGQFMDKIRKEGKTGSEAQQLMAYFLPSSKASGWNIDAPLPETLPEMAGIQLGSSSTLNQASTYHFHIYSTKHNTHITLSKPNRDAIISVSCGNLGFKKAQRGSYDAAFQLAAYVLNRMNEDPKLMNSMRKMDLVYRGFGPGREAVTKAILGQEGINMRGKITNVMDSTRLKFGGTRSRAIRRLG